MLSFLDNTDRRNQERRHSPQEIVSRGRTARLTQRQGGYRSTNNVHRTCGLLREQGH